MTQSMFRERLVRELGGDRTLCVCMQNPSTAEADDPAKNDPTIRRLIGFTTRLGFGRLVVVNTYLYRASKPEDLYRWLFSLSLGARQGHQAAALTNAIMEAREASMFIAAWGNGIANDRWPRTFADEIQNAGVNLYVFGLTQLGFPIHPLARGAHRIPDNCEPGLWREGKRSS